MPRALETYSLNIRLVISFHWLAISLNKEEIQHHSSLLILSELVVLLIIQEHDGSYIDFSVPEE